VAGGEVPAAAGAPAAPSSDPTICTSAGNDLEITRFVDGLGGTGARIRYATSPTQTTTARGTSFPIATAKEVRLAGKSVAQARELLAADPGVLGLLGKGLTLDALGIVCRADPAAAVAPAKRTSTSDGLVCTNTGSALGNNRFELFGVSEGGKSAGTKISYTEATTELTTDKGTSLPVTTTTDLVLTGRTVVEARELLASDPGVLEVLERELTLDMIRMECE
jgi:hypothetical protein